MIKHEHMELENISKKQLEDLIRCAGKFEYFNYVLEELDGTLGMVRYFQSYDFPKSYEDNYRDYKKYVEAKVKSAKELARFSNTDIVLEFPVHPVIAKGICINHLTSSYPRAKVLHMMNIVFDSQTLSVAEALYDVQDMGEEIIESDGTIIDPINLSYTIKPQ